MQASALTDALRDLWGPGIVFLALCAWLIRRALRAARNESILEEQRLREALGQGGALGATASPTSTPTPNATPTSTPTEAPTPRSPARVPAQLFRADVRGASQEHLDVVARLLAEREATAGAKRAEVLWVRSNRTHVAWSELRPGNREVICVAQVEAGTVVARWQFG